MALTYKKNDELEKMLKNFAKLPEDLEKALKPKDDKAATDKDRQR